jgi:hypothetical protein
MSRFIPRSFFGKVAAAFGFILVFCLIATFTQHAYRSVRPQSAFESITGRSLPAGVTAIQYGTDITDNLFHETHYWLLTGDAASLRRVTEGTGFSLSDDAAHMLPNMQDLFDLSLTSADVVAGYEWELDRDRWFCIFRGEQSALYAH